MKKYIDISGFHIESPNRGNAALTYGAIAFLKKEGLLSKDHELVFFQWYINPFKRKKWNWSKVYEIDGERVVFNMRPIHYIEKKLAEHGIRLPFTQFGRTICEIEYEAADYGGDGFSDIYGEKSFLTRMNQTFLLWKFNIPLIMLPQSIGPFKSMKYKELANKVLKYASKVYVRDNSYTTELNRMGIEYILSRDLSSYMSPQPWSIEVSENSVGINVSGLAYFNKFNGLEGRFENYPLLIHEIVNFFINKNKYIYLIPHSYNYNNPELYNDDMIACKEVYQSLRCREHVVFVCDNLSSPKVKYLISKMNFFIGTRMHANFAAIYTNTPLFGLSYSPKFKGGFDANNLDGNLLTSDILDLTKDGIYSVINKIETVYNLYEKKNNCN